MNNLPQFTTRNRVPAQYRSPFRELTRLQRELDRAFDGFFAPIEQMPVWPSLDRELSSFASDWNPSCDVEEKGGHYIMSFDLPGVKKDDIKIEIKDRRLTVSGERKEQREDQGKNRYHSERFHGAFARSFEIPQSIKAEQIQADYRDGVLTLAVPKEEVAQAQQVKIGESKPGFFERLLGKKEETKSHTVEVEKSNVKIA